MRELGYILYLYNSLVKKPYKEWERAKREEAKELANYEPEIGMTKKEVSMGKWGSPDDINTTITEKGTSEQWCYSGYKYVYFEDGIVTAIQK